MADVYDTLRSGGIVPVIALEDASVAADLARALVRGGLSAAEVTFRTECAVEAIRAMCAAVPDMLVGAGTVLTVAQAEAAVRSGARFIVSPGYNPEVVDWCVENDIPTVPGVATASEIMACVNKGLSHLKLFPAERLGGCRILEDFAGPFSHCAFMPTGGISAENLSDYMKLENVFCVGGSWMVRKPLIEARQWDEITRLCVDARTRCGRFA